MLFVAAKIEFFWILIEARIGSSDVDALGQKEFSKILAETFSHFRKIGERMDFFPILQQKSEYSVGFLKNDDQNEKNSYYN